MTVLPDDGLPLAAEFPEATHEQWQRLVEGVLRKSGRDASGDDAERALSTTIEDGLTTRPLYTARDAVADAGFPGFAPFVRGGRPEGVVSGGWDVRQRHTGSDPARVNEDVLTDLENGATSVWLVLGPGGLTPDGLGRALDGVYLDLAPVALEAGEGYGAAGRALLALHEERGADPALVRGRLGADPLGYEARSGRPTGTGDAVELARAALARWPGVRALTADALPYHEAGASAVQELGLSLATGVAYLRLLTDAGLDVAEACGQLEFRYAASADQFLTIAKSRAARRLWARVAEVSGAPGPVGAQRQHAVTSSVMMTRRDPWVNMLRTTLAALGAGVGGADAVTVLPFDEAIGAPDAFARRIARNTSTILVEESQLARVTDPAGGSWYVERLTDELAHAGWEFFREVERAGGLPGALRSGFVAERLAATWAARKRRLATRREPVTGVSEFPSLVERPVERAAPDARVSGGLPRVRRDEDFEALRARADAHLARTGVRPRVFLAALGPAAEHTARVTFAANLFRAGGIEPVHDPVTVDAESAAGAFAASGAGIACLCSGDDRYLTEAGPVAAALRGAGAGRVLLAGRPADRPGVAVDGHVFAGGDAVETLASVLDQLGVA
ncbi:methylmalonyl-CoA mutase family protein [Streptomyces sp. JNUCC 64]